MTPASTGADPEILAGGSGGSAAGCNGRRRPGYLAEPPEANDFWKFWAKINSFWGHFSGFTTKTHFLLCKF